MTTVAMADHHRRSARRITDVPAIALTKDRFRGTEADLREMHHGHLAAISYLDAQVGRVLAEVDRLKLRDDTVIVFWSDHGLHLGEHGLRRKTTVFELDAHVPLIISTPQHKPSQRTQALVELLDLYPTLTALCGLETPRTVEGKSLVTVLKNPQTTLREAALTQTSRPNYLRGKLPQAMGYSIRTKRYRYTGVAEFQDGRCRVTGTIRPRQRSTRDAKRRQRQDAHSNSWLFALNTSADTEVPVSGFYASCNSPVTRSTSSPADSSPVIVTSWHSIRLRNHVCCRLAN